MTTNVKDGVIRVDQLRTKHPFTCEDCKSRRGGKRKGRYIIHICSHRVSGTFCPGCVARLEAEWGAALEPVQGREKVAA